MGKNLLYEKYQTLHSKYPDFVWKPWARPILQAVSPLIRRFPVQVSFESEIPKDGVSIFACNHQNFYDTLVVNHALKKYRYCVLAGDEPRGTVTGLSFETHGVVWINRSNSESRLQSTATLLDILRSGLSLGWSPEGTWNTTENRLLLPLSRGMSKIAITASRDVKVYIVPVVTDYTYAKDSAKVKRASVQVCRAIPVSPEMEPIQLTEYLETVFWTTRWEQIKHQMEESPFSIHVGNDAVYPRKQLSREKWTEFVKGLHAQYKTDWSAEESYAIKTQTQRDRLEILSVLPRILE